jgi:hypothetical protein
MKAIVFVEGSEGAVHGGAPELFVLVSGGETV